LRGNINYQVNQLWLKVDGISVSKAATRKDSDVKGQNGHKVSDKVHSYNSKDEFINRAKELATYAKDNFNINDMQAISNEVIIKYIQKKIDKGLKYRSISTYISQLEKIQLALSKFTKHKAEHFQLFTRDTLKKVREIAKANAVISKHKNRAFANPEVIKNGLKDYMKVSFELQLVHGLRVNEATFIKKSQINGNVFTIQGKGGYTREIQLKEDLLNRLKKELKKNNGKIKIPYSTYRKYLKDSATRSNQDFEGTHGLRFNYVQKEYNEKIKEFKNHNKALKVISYNIGHHRDKITEHYRRPSD
jgi:hypothetical protein